EPIPAILTAPLDLVIPRDHRDRIRQHTRCHVAALRETARSAEVHAYVRNRGLWNTNWPAQTIIEPEARRVNQVRRIERDGDAIESKACFIRHAGREDMHILQGPDLAMRRPMVAPPRQCVALQVRLCTYVLLERIEAMQRVVLPK